MHETQFFDASFVVLTCFLAFMGIALKFGYQKTIQGIDNQIKEVSLALEEAQTLLKIAEERKSVEKQLEKQFASEIADMKKSAEKQIEELQRQTESDIKSILERKQQAADSTADLLRNSTILHIQESLTQDAVELVHKNITKSSSTASQAINDVALEELKNLLTTVGSNSNGGSKNKAIA